MFSNHGLGTLIYTNEYENIRPAKKKDVRAIQMLTKQAVEAEELVKRTRAMIERNLADYYIFEIDRNPVVFTPHLIPINRGILATIYVRLKPGTTEEMLADAYADAYANAPMIRLTGADLPQIKHVAYTNFCGIGWRVDGFGRAVLVSVIDNLLKGAASQAVQNVNVMFGLPEETGLL